MSNKSKNAGRVVGRALELLLGAMGGILWGASFSLALIYLYRAGYMAGWPAAILAVSAFAGLLFWGLIRARLFMCYAVPLVMFLLTGDGPAEGVEMPARPGFSILLLFAGLVALCLAAALVEMAAFVIGICAFTCYGVVARGIAQDLDR
jgi:hypothetical protein